MNVRRLRWRFYKKRGGPRGLGYRCKDYCAGCIVCESYRYLDQHGRFPTFEEISPICELIMMGQWSEEMGLPFDAAEFLKDEEAIDEFLKASAEMSDPAVQANAEATAIRAKRLRNEAMDALVVSGHSSPTFSFEDVAQGVKNARETKSRK